MKTIALGDGADFEGWRRQARELLRLGVPPQQVNWLVDGEASLLIDEAPKAGVGELQPVADARIPAEFITLMQALICHHDPQRYALAYRLSWRLTHGERELLKFITDADVVRARNAEKNVRRDSHKMKAFVRFREVTADDGRTVFVAWFEPEHYIVERVAPFFVRRFTGMRWSILTPYRSAHWDGETLHYGPGATKADAPTEDVLETYWRTYYANIFNPARLKIQAMQSEMPVKYWKNLPEASLISELIREARPRTLAMIEAEATMPKKRIAAPSEFEAPAILQGSLSELRAEAKACRACPLWAPATQTVFGEGPEKARLMVVGEQPGDKEDLAGKPFVGPAGKLLDKALGEAKLDRGTIYVTNTVKHFKFTAKNIFRQHQGANREEQKACRPWLEAEIARIQPELILCLGGMAATNLIDPKFKLLSERGEWREWADGTRLMATVHPSYLLRLRDAEARQQGFDDFVRDLRRVATALAA